MRNFLSTKASFLLGFAMVTAISFSLIGVSFARLNNDIGANTALSNLSNTSINTNLLPDGNNTRDLGAFGFAWNDIFVSGTAFISTAIITISTADGPITPNLNNSYDLGAFGSAWKDFYVSGTLFIGDPTGAGTSTFSNSIQMAVFDVTSSTVTSTMANGLILTGGCIEINGACIPNTEGANTALSNLASVAINTALISDTADTDDLGTEALFWRKLYLTSDISFEGSTDNTVQTTFVITNPTSADKTITFQDADGIVAMDTSAVTDLEGDKLSITAGTLNVTETDPLSATLALDNLASVAINTSLLSDANNTDDLGSFALTWNNLFVSSTSYLGSATTTMINPWANNTSDLGNFDNAWNNLFVSSTAHLNYVSSTALDLGLLTMTGNIVMGDNSVTGIDTLTFTDTGGTIAGIQNQNLLDKVAAEAITGAWDFGGATSLEIPNTANPTVNAIGEIAWDTTTNTFKIFGDKEYVFPPFGTTGFTYNTTTVWSGTTTFFLAPAAATLTFTEALCETNAGSLNVSLNDGTNKADDIVASTTIGLFNFSTNNTWGKAESIRVDVGTPLASPTSTACRFIFEYTP